MDPLGGQPMIETLIIADDLSGAADCAVACAAAGSATVIFDPTADLSGAAAVSVDVNSRAMTAREAGVAVAEAVQLLYGQSTRNLYQKMDSTLRGNWASELVHIRRAAATVLGHAPFAIVAPAFPATGGATIDGHVQVNGTPLEDTELWKQAGLTGSADLQALLTEAGLKVGLAALEQVALGREAFMTRLAKWREAGCDAVVCDAQTEDDLVTVAAASLTLPERPLWVGSAGLMQALVRAGKDEGTPSSARTWKAAGKSILVVVGSASGASHTQFDALAEEQDVTSLIIPPSALRKGADPERVQTHVQALDRALAAGSDLAVTIGGEPINLQDGPQLAVALAELIAPRLSDAGGLVVTGGETARAILVSAGIWGLSMQGEIEPGVPVGLSMGDIAIPVVTKAGAFGDRMTLIRCRAALRGHQCGRPISITNE
jgi:uncharacterized protein YgbK (DUF1537 family)